VSRPSRTAASQNVKNENPLWVPSSTTVDGRRADMIQNANGPCSSQADRTIRGGCQYDTALAHGVRSRSMVTQTTLVMSGTL
jgi:hypothetical protein